jgi:hypothetical protein
MRAKQSAEQEFLLHHSDSRHHAARLCQQHFDELELRGKTAAVNISVTSAQRAVANYVRFFPRTAMYLVFGYAVEKHKQELQLQQDILAAVAALPPGRSATKAFFDKYNARISHENVYATCFFYATRKIADRLCMDHLAELARRRSSGQAGNGALTAAQHAVLHSNTCTSARGEGLYTVFCWVVAKKTKHQTASVQ